jgi:hypothetical protein
MSKSSPENKKTLLYNLIFFIFCGGLLLFLLNAPEETTTPLPHDTEHEKFFSMGKKEAEKFCGECHNPEGIALPENHPPKYRCLFCHKKQ